MIENYMIFLTEYRLTLDTKHCITICRTCTKRAVNSEPGGEFKLWNETKYGKGNRLSLLKSGKYFVLNFSCNSSLQHVCHLMWLLKQRADESIVMTHAENSSQEHLNCFELQFRWNLLKAEFLTKNSRDELASIVVVRVVSKLKKMI